MINITDLVEVVHEYTLSAEICEYLMSKRQPLVLHDYIAVIKDIKENGL